MALYKDMGDLNLLIAVCRLGQAKAELNIFMPWFTRGCLKNFRHQFLSTECQSTYHLHFQQIAFNTLQGQMWHFGFKRTPCLLES